MPLHEVCLIVAEGNYVRLHWRDVRPLLGRPLSSLEERLDPQRFFRANRRQIINVEFIEDGGTRHQRAAARATARRPGGRDLAAPGAHLQDADERMIPAPGAER